MHVKGPNEKHIQVQLHGDLLIEHIDAISGGYSVYCLYGTLDFKFCMFKSYDTVVLGVQPLPRTRDIEKEHYFQM